MKRLEQKKTSLRECEIIVFKPTKLPVKPYE